MVDHRKDDNYCLLCDLDISSTGGWETHRDSEQHQHNLKTASQDRLSHFRNPYDARLKCDICHGWMRNKPTSNTPLKRGPGSIGYGGICVNCTKKQQESKIGNTTH
jgi:hypothetical protein